MDKSVVAIPVRDEADRIGACLHALNAQTRLPDAVVLLLNNCTDRTESDRSRDGAATAVSAWTLSVVDWPPAQANAGHARRLAMAAAAELAGTHGVLLTTDADGVVAPDWVAAKSRRRWTRGADVVCGRAIIDPVEAMLIPAHLHEDDARECRLDWIAG